MTSKGKMIEAIYGACLTKRATLVIFYLINRANQELTCFPSVKTIAAECNMSTRTVQRALNDLEEAGFLERESRFHDKGGQRSSLFKIIFTMEHPEEVEFEELKSTNNDMSNKLEEQSTYGIQQSSLDDMKKEGFGILYIVKYFFRKILSGGV